MKKIVFMALSLAMLTFAVLPLSAEKGWKKGDGNGKCGSMTGMHQPFMHFNKMQEKLGLTDNQVDKMYKIHKDYMDKFYQNRKNADKINDLKVKFREEMAGVLTPEQKAKMDEFKKNHKKGDKKK